MPDFYKMVLRLDAENDRLHKNLEKSTRRIQKFEKSSDKALKSVKRSFAGISRAFSAAAIGGGLLALTRNTISTIDHMAKFSDRIGISVEALSNLTFAAERAGVAQNTLETSLQRQTRRVAEAAAGTGEATNALDELGISAKALNQLSPDEQFLALAEALEGVTSQNDRVRLAFKLWDSEGVRMLQVAQGGADAVRGLMERNRELGNEVSTRTAKSIEKLNDRLTDLSTAASGTARVWLNTFAPAIEAVTEKLQLALVGYRAWLNLLGQGGAETNIAKVQKEFEEASAGAAKLQKEFNELEDDFVGRAKALWLGPQLVLAINRTDELKQRLQELRSSASADTGSKSDPLASLGLAPGESNVQKRGKTSESFASASASGRTRETSFGLVADADAHLQLFEQLKREADALTESVRTPWEVAADELTRYDELLEANLITQDTWARATNEAIDGASDGIEKLVEETETADSAWRDLGITFSSAFEDAVVSGAKLSDVVDGLAEDIQRILVRKLFTEKIAGFFSAQAQGSSGGGFAGFLSNLFKADGGPVAAGIPYVVGEKGPELFVPNNAGTIVPNAKTGMTNNINIRVDGGATSSGRTSQNQLATRIGQAVDRALKRNT